MSELTISARVNQLTDSVGRESFDQKRSSKTYEGKINEFLDKVLDLQAHYKERSEKLESINEGLRELTWFDHYDVLDEELISINRLIATARDLHSIIIRNYAAINKNLRPMGVCNRELNRLKLAIDILKENTQTLEEVFIFQPNDEEINTILKEFEFSK